LLRLLGYTLFENLSRRRYLNLLLSYNHIDKRYQVVKVERDHLTQTAVLKGWLGHVYGLPYQMMLCSFGTT